MGDDVFRIRHGQSGFSMIAMLIVILGLAILIYLTVLYLGGDTRSVRVQPSPQMPGKTTAVAPTVNRKGMDAGQKTVNKTPESKPVAPEASQPLMPRTATPDIGAGSTSPDEKKLEKLRGIQRRLQKMISEGKGAVDTKKLDGVLAELQALPGQHGRVGGVDIGVIRRNLKRAEEMEKLALKVQAMAADPMQSKSGEFKAAMARLQQLQKEMEPVVPMPVPSSVAPGANQ